MKSEFDDKTVTGDGNNKGNLSKEGDKSLFEHASLLSLNDASDEFFDDFESFDYDQSVAGWSPESLSKTWLQDVDAPSLLTDAGVVEKLLDFEETMHVLVQKQGYVDLQEMAREESILCCYGTLPKDPIGTLPCTWTTADPATFLICGKSYLEDHQKVKAKETLMRMIGVDWLRSDKREDDFGDVRGALFRNMQDRLDSSFSL